MLYRSLAIVALTAGGHIVARPALADSFRSAPGATPVVTGSIAIPSAIPSSWHTIVLPAPRATPRTARVSRPAQSAGKDKDTASAITTGAINRPSAPAENHQPKLTGTPHALKGLASYYSSGEVTANGEPYDKRAMTAAHKTLPFGTKVRVTRLDTGSEVVVRINDRGPFKPGRVIDLSEIAAEHIGLTGVGLTAVSLEVIGK